MKTLTYKHNVSGSSAIPQQVTKPLLQVLQSKAIKFGKKSTPRIRNGIMAGLVEQGWPDAPSKLSTESSITVTSVREGVALCIQFGNISRAFYDLLKMQVLAEKGRVESGVLIVPTSSAAKGINSNLATFERVTRELPIFKDVITMPVLVVGVEEGKA